MASNLSSVQTVNNINSLIGQRINAQVQFGTNNMPANSLPGWFGGGTGDIGYIAQGHANVVGNAGAQRLNDLVAYYTGLFARMCRKRMVIYYNNNGVMDVIGDTTGVGNFSSWPTWALTGLGTELVAGRQINYNDIVNHLNRMYTQWWNNAGGPVVETLTNTVCHYSCHSNCHGNRGRR